jgi:anti-sigma-K factor RskA
MTGPSEHSRDEAMVAWVLGELPEAEREAFVRRLATDPALAREVAELEEALAVFGTAEPVAAPAGLRQRVLALAEVAPTPPPTPTHGVAPTRPLLARTAPWIGLAAAAAIILAIKFQADTRELAAAQAIATAEVAALKAALAERDSLLVRLTDPDAETVSLAATGAPTPRVKVQLDRKRRLAILSVASLDPAPEGQTYQLWYVVDGTPVPSSTFEPSAGGSVLLASIPLPSEAGVQALAITLEPTGGSQVPTMPILFLGTVGSE